MSDTPTQFSDLKLDPKVLQAISEAGYTTPTPIQLGAIPPALEGRDVLGIAQTGTGKTAGFTLPMITLLGRGRARARMPRSLVLCPTRELAAQVAENFDTYSKHTRLTKALLIGGVSFGEQDKLIDRGVDVLIATPGRLLDHFERGKLLLTGVQIMVVDEADRMLDMGFIPDIERIFTLTPFTRQTLFFSATMAPEIERITDTFLHAPARIEVARQATASETITQRLIEITPTRKDQTAKQKRELLRAVIDAESEALKNAIIFCNRKTEVDVVAKSLKAHGYDAAPIHGDLDQSQRTRTLEGFREGTLRFLVASDVAARGLDIPAVSHVFNFDLPSHAEDYVHRIGRTGRAGREGTAVSLAVPADEKYLAAIESLLKKSLPRASVPEGFSLSDAAQNAPRAQSDRGGRDNGRSRGRGGRDRREQRAPEQDRPAQDRPATEARAEVEARPEREARPEPRHERREEPRRDDRRSTARDGRPETRGERSDHRGGERRDDRRGPVAGFGDHVPDFMTHSFRISPPAAEGDGEHVVQPAKADNQASGESSTARASQPPAQGRGRSARKPVAAAAETVPETVPEHPPAAEASAERETQPVPTAEAAPLPEAPVVAEPAAQPDAPEAAGTKAGSKRPARARRPAKPKAHEAAAGDAAAEAPAPADAPASTRTRSRRKPAAAQPDAEVATQAEGEAPSPRRSRVRRKPAADDAAPLPEPAEAAAPVVRDEA